ncbi:MAG: hypothetical protein H0T92_23710 [Pyrinomonadaceae bacterium]|nr:hypothetical protein [Pyrinomonadaceae bacterium]
MLNNILGYTRPKFAPLLLVLIFGFNAANAQTVVSSQQQSTAETSVRASTATTGEDDLRCAGFIQYAPSPNSLEIVGGEQEQEQRIYSEGDNVFINAGARQGIRVGQEFAVVRPRGQFTTKLTRKKGWLGVYTQEVGRLRVIEVKDQVSVALVTGLCETILLGDLLRAATPPQSIKQSTERAAVELDRFTDENGKQRGRIVLARDGREMLSRNQIVYIDLGQEDQIKPGDYLTIYRPAGTGNITRFRDEEVTPAANSGFQSDRFRGGKFSNKVQRVKRPNQTGVFGPTVTTPDVKRRRPPVPRKIVGELVILRTETRTATAVITRVAQEVHTGDLVELQ